MSNHTHQTVPTQYVDANGIRFAYRRFGKKSSLPPLVFNQHYTGTMDYWDPLVTNGLAQNREVILFNNTGLSSTSGEVPTTIQQMGADAIVFIRALGLKQVDVLGFSIGGMVAQEIALQAPELVRRLVLVGTGPRGADMSSSESPQIFGATYEGPEDLWLSVHFLPTPHSQAAGKRFIERKLLRKDRDPEVSLQAAANLRQSIGNYVAQSRDIITQIQQPTLIVQGSKDRIIPTINSYFMQQMMPNAELIIYPDSNHGSFYQYPELFVSQTEQFLSWIIENGFPTQPNN